MTILGSQLVKLNQSSAGGLEETTLNPPYSENDRTLPISILYLDDDTNLLIIMKRFLERSDEYHVCTVSDSFEAIEMVGINAYDCILSDYNMPAMDGISFLKKIRSQGILTPFILISSTPREEIEQEARDAGADLYIPKDEVRNGFFQNIRFLIQEIILTRDDGQ